MRSQRRLGSIVKSMAEATQKCRNLRTEEIARTKFLTLETITWTDGQRERQWNTANRTTRQAGSDVDAVAIFPRLRSRIHPPSTLVVLQYRPPLGKPTVEFPAGLIDEGETPEQAALRELNEETGYVGTVSNTSVTTVLCPGLTNESLKNITVDVDLDDPVNAKPLQNLDEGENIEVRRIPLNNLLEELNRLSSEGYVVFNGLYNLALGITLNAPSG